MSTPKRNYNNKDVDMLITISTITNKQFLISKRVTWADPFLENLRNNIDSTIKKHLGIGSAKQLRQATQAVKKIHNTASKELALLKVQVQEDFKENKPAEMKS